MSSSSVLVLLDVLLRRLVLPLALLAAVVVRYDFLSFVYFLFLLGFAFLPSPRLKSQKAVSVVFLGVLLAFSVVAAVGQALFQITLISSLDYTLTACEWPEPIWRQFGFVQFDVPVVDVIRHLIPDVVVFVVALLTLIVDAKVMTSHSSRGEDRARSEGEGERIDDAAEAGAQPEGVVSRNELTGISGDGGEPYLPNAQCYWKVPKAVEYLLDLGIFFLLGLSGVAVPSVTSFVYYGLFLVFLVIWSVHLKLLPVRRVLRTLVMFYSACHLLLLYLYQFQVTQDRIPVEPTDTKKSLLARLFGLTPVIKTDCDRPTQLLLNEDAIYTEFLSPAVILALFYFLTLDFRLWIFTPHVLWSAHHTYCLPVMDQLPSSRVFCILKRGRDQQQSVWTRYGTYSIEGPSKSEAGAHPAGPSVISEGAKGDTPYTEFEDERLDGAPDPDNAQEKGKKITWDWFLERLFHYSSLTWGLLMSFNYTISIVAMMLWSVVYPSWLALVLLLWACFIWLIPKVTPKNSLYYTSPLLVLYALGLLMLQYVFSLDLTKDELSHSDSLGVECTGGNSTGCRSVVLLVKTCFTMAFFASFNEFVTIVKRRLQERKPWRHRGSDSPDGEIPLTEVSDTELDQEGSPDEISRTKDARNKLYRSAKDLLGSIWVLVVVGAFLLVTLTGDPSLLKTVYLVFFFIFLITYQVSHHYWYYLSFPLWWLLVVYAVLELILVYTYQFDVVSDAWKRAYNHSSLDVGFHELFTSIGLVKYRINTFDALITTLFPPAVFIAVMALQLRYFRPQRKAISPEDEGLTALDFTSLMPKFVRSAVYHAQKETVAAEVEETRDGAGEAGDEAEEEEPPENIQAKESTLLPRSDSVTSSEPSRSTLGKMYRVAQYVLLKLKKFIIALTRLFWRFMDLHLHKIATLVLFAVAISQISAGYWVLLLLLLIVVPLPVLNPLTYPLLTLYIGSFTTLKMIYQVPLLKPSSFNFSDNCPAVNESETQGEVFNYTYSSRDGDAAWLGLHKADDFGSYVAAPIFGALLLSMWFSVRRYQASYYTRHREVQVQPWESGSLFLGVPREKADKSIWGATKYLINHFFEMYGVEVSWIMLVITVAVRIDVYGVFYALALGLLLFTPRRFLAPVWLCYLLVHGALLMLQYSFLLGVPPGACFSPGGDRDYPWSHLSDPLKKWLFLTDYPQILDKEPLYADFLVYLLVCLQMYLFFSNPLKKGGRDETDRDIPEIFKMEYLLDHIKSFVFQYLFWVSLFLIFFTAATRVSLFGICYLIISFIFLYRGQDILKDRALTRHRWWAFLRLLTWLVLLIRVSLEIVGCVFLEGGKCALVLLFNAGCDRSDYYGSPEIDCSTTNVGLWVDALNFGVITLQIIAFDTVYSEMVRIELIAREERAGYFADVFDQKLEMKQEEARERKERELQEVEEAVEDLSTSEKIIDHVLHAGVRIPPGIMKASTKKRNVGTKAEADPGFEFSEETVSLTASSEEPKSKPTEVGDTESQEEDTSESTLARYGKLVYKVFIETVDAFIDWVESTSALYRDVVAELKRQSESEAAPERAEAYPFARDAEGYGTTGDSSLKKEDAPASGVYGDSGLVSMETPEEGEGAKRKVEVEVHDRDSYTAVPLDADETTPLSKLPKDYKSVQFEEKGDVLIEAFHIAPTEEEERLIAEFEAKVGERAKGYSERPSRLITALYYAFLAHSEYVVFFLVIVNVLVNGSILSLVYAFLMFLWGLLSIPWPTRSFWLTLIFYTMVVVTLKYGFQFHDIQYPGDPNGGLYIPVIIGIEYQENYFSNVVWDLFLLIALLFHRGLLIESGLWRDTKREEETSNLFMQIWYDVKRFIKRLLNPEISLGASDYYVIMLSFDVLCFITIIFGFASFGVGIEGQGISEVASYIETNYIPLPFVLMLMLQFFSVLVDRAVYLRKSLAGKFIYLIILLVIWHVWLFFLVPSYLITGRPFTSNAAAQLIYFFKSLYFITSAVQIVSGYPTRILGYFLGRSYHKISGLAFTVYRLIPLLPELREVMDWMFTPTTLELLHWFRVQEIYAQIYLVKVRREKEKASPRDLGDPYSMLIKIAIGSIIVAALVLLIWGPLLLFSIINTVSQPNPPVGVNIRLSIGGYEPLLDTSAQQQNIMGLSLGDYDTLRNEFRESPVFRVFSREFQREDFSRVLFSGAATSLWTITPPANDLLREELENVLNTNNSTTLEFSWSILREPSTGLAAETVAGVNTILLTSTSNRDTIQGFIDSLEGENVNVSLQNLYPQYIISPANGPSGNFTALSQFSYNTPNVSCYTNLNSDPNNESLTWWSLFQNSSHIISSPAESPNDLEMIIYSVRIAPPILSSLAGIGIIGLYISVVLVIGSLIRSTIADLPRELLVDEIVNPDPLLELCSGIFLVREHKHFKLEEILVGKLFAIFRSPERLIKLTEEEPKAHEKTD